MRLSVSNIAWETHDDTAVAALLRSCGVDAIDLAPSKYFSITTELRDGEILKVRDWWAQQGMEVIGMQSLLFGTQGLNLFDSEDSRQRMLAHLETVCRIGAVLGATRLTFGSPKNRDRTGLSDAQAHDVALAFFGRLAHMAAQWGVVMCLEPTPACYNGNFMTNTADTLAVVKAVNHSALRLQLDVGAMVINSEPPNEISRFANWIGHIHVSEPGLSPLGTHPDMNHAAYAQSLSQCQKTGIISLEMLTGQQALPLQALQSAIKLAKNSYIAPYQ